MLPAAGATQAALRKARQPLCPMPRDTVPTMNRQTKHKTESQRFVKLKEVQANAQSQRFCTTFNFTPTHPSPPTTQIHKLNF